MKTKKITTTLFVGLFLACLSAQEGLDAQKMAEYQSREMAKELKLNDAQQGRIEAINLKYAKKMFAIREADGGMFGKMGEIKALKKAKHTNLEAVLTPDQMEKYREELEPKFRRYFRKQMGP
ncbi:hypothetical protein [Spongiimicrobium sp. 2-473A-2-J]|uniref:hypothetical protein n=1 Tax=Eudoraea algarum TaxID=3417568 RepID=UPI003D35BBFC